MKNDICSDVIERFLASDKYEALPFLSALHCLRCKKCRSLIKTLRTAEAAAGSAAKKRLFEGAADDPVILRIMERLEPLRTYDGADFPRTISLKRWISAGCILITAIVLFGLFSTIDGAEKMQLLLYLCFALFISGYCAFFVGGNLNFFIKKIRTIRAV
ncbi:hypothetical protein V1L52_03770 [Treponema sp. HNW]|uniref:hypothetical protein n=1 Tax=Treponema sp. HNW TaxID=3116654 RepID=UPI003D123D6E